ncbi:thioredoxin family protein [Chryseobacterium sp. IT-36CA2]|uniref:thioredoxin family protein n=1 Tax=Chryseobacterium sp. IT-36CA2 TaxID=3026460 RepID=UPI0039E18E7D
MTKLNMIILLFISIILFGQTETKGIHFEDGDFKTLLSKAKKENKLLFIDAYTDWCAPCKLMAKKIFTQESVGNYYNTKFINAKFDMEKGEGQTIAKQYSITSFPSFLFIDGDGNIVHRQVGSCNESEFIKLAKDAEDPDQNVQGLMKKFENGDRDAQLIKKLYEFTLFQNNEIAKKVTTVYFSTIEDKNITKKDAEALLERVEDSDDPLYKIMIEKEKTIRKLLGDKAFNDSKEDIIKKGIAKIAYNKESNQFDEVYFLKEATKVLGKEKAKQALYEAKANKALDNKDYTSYEKIILEQYSTIPKDASPEELMQAAWRFEKLISTPESLKKAVIWCKESIKKKENYFNTQTLAKLYRKLGDKANALLWAKKSLELSKKKGIENEDAEEIIKSLQ